MQVQETKIKGVYEITPDVFPDERGYFVETYNKQKLEVEGITYDFVQDNESKSTHGVLRGMHLQKGEHAQTKLVRCVTGKILDVAVDMRPDSPTYLQHVVAELSGDNKKQLLIHKDCAHGFLVLSDEAIVCYKVDALYNKESEGSYMWNDPKLGVEWPLAKEEIILSEKDKLHNLL